MNRSRCTRPTSFAAVVIIVGACSSGLQPTEPIQSSQAEAAPVFLEELNVQARLELECAGSATSGPPTGFEVVSDTVALPSSPDHPALQTSARKAADGSTYYFAKTGLFWNTASSFELVVPDHQRSRMAIGWGGPAPLAHSVEMNCNGEDRWVALPGGYWVSEPFCADLIVRSNGNERTIQVGLGTSCDGQAPPQGSSDG